MIWQLAALAGSVACVGANIDISLDLPAAAEVVSYKDFAVSELNETLLRDPRALFTPPAVAARSPPFFQVFDAAFLDVLGPAPSIRVIAANESYAFAHEAPVWLEQLDELWFCANAGGPLGMSDREHNNAVFKLDMKAVEQSAAPVEYQHVPLPGFVQMTNGGTNLKDGLLLINSGRDVLPSNVVHIRDPSKPEDARVVVNNFFGRPFSSLNDAKVHPTTGALFMTDAPYGFLQDFRDTPSMPNQVYRLELDSGAIKVATDDVDIANGIAFSNDGKVAYIADSAAGHARSYDGRRPATIYEFDVLEPSGVFANKRVFAYIDTGIPDGLQVDSAGRVYAGCGDGVHVFARHGQLLGKIYLGKMCANMAFAGDGRLVMLAETEIYMAQLASSPQALETF